MTGDDGEALSFGDTIAADTTVAVAIAPVLTGTANSVATTGATEDTIFDEALTFRALFGAGRTDEPGTTLGAAGKEGPGLSFADALELYIGVSLDIAVQLGVSVGIAVGVGVGVGIAVGVGISVSVSFGVSVSVGISVSFGVSVSVGISVSVNVGVGIGVGVSVSVSVSVGIGV